MQTYEAEVNDWTRERFSEACEDLGENFTVRDVLGRLEATHPGYDFRPVCGLVLQELLFAHKFVKVGIHDPANEQWYVLPDP